VTLHLEIAGVHFSASVPTGLHAVLDDPRYAPFLGESDAGPGRVEVPVALVMDAAPDVSGLPPVFDSGSAWRVFRDGADLLFEYRLPVLAGERLWTARVSGPPPRVTVHCGPSLLDDARGPGTLHSPLSYPLDQLLLMLILPSHQGVVVHAAGVRRGQRAVAFLGRSGAGKSTLSGLLAGRPELDRMSDDRIALRRVAGEFRAWGTPWAGTERVAANESAPLAAIAFLHKSNETRLQPIDPSAGLEQILPVASVPWFDREQMLSCLGFCEDLLARVPLYELHFRKHAEVGEVIAPLF